MTDIMDTLLDLVKELETGERVTSDEVITALLAAVDELETARLNARLIAAAPDLLDALKAWVSAADDDADYAAMKKAEAAIAKAEGM